MHYQLFVLSILALLPLAGFATPLVSPWDDVSVKHAWKTVPDNWESLGPPHPNTTIDLYIALKPENEKALIDALYEVSTPGHTKYGAHLSKEGVAELVAPHPSTLELVHSWLAHHGVEPSSISTTHGGNWLTLTNVPVFKANKLLGASFRLYRYSGTNDSAILRTVDYSLPTVLHAHVQTVAPTTAFASSHTLKQTPQMHPVGAAGAPAKAALRQLPNPGFDPNEGVTPDFLRWLYKTWAYEPKEIAQNALGIAGFLDQFVSVDDLELFMTKYRSEVVNPTFHLVEINDSKFNPDVPGIEGNTNMQYAQAIAYPTTTVFYSVAGQMKWLLDEGPNYGEPIWGDSYLMWLAYMLDQEDQHLPQTISVSYGQNENIFPPEYLDPMCTLFGQLGARGITILFSSGDDGVGAGNCTDQYGKVQFIPKFPASCPWVTSVGGTTGLLPETGVALSGGGFSNFFRQPDYQNVSVPSYLKYHLGPKNQGLYNPVGRGIPDISAQALDFAIIVNETRIFVSGTSCATPTVAGIITLLNDFLLSEGESPLGWLNPWLYGNGKHGLNDIKSGRSKGCEGKYGFSAVNGWDPVTGLGTPDFFELMHVLFVTKILPKIQKGEIPGRAFSGLLNTSDAMTVPT